MAVPYDSASKFQEYARPEMLVSTDWLAEHLDDPALVVAESDEDVLLYETGHIPGAVKLDWHTELNDPVGGVRAVGVQPVRAPGRASPRRGPGQVDRRGPAAEHRGPAAVPRQLPGGRAR
jgi:hypothetical protein